jgi:hypothetical protein
MAAAVVDHVDEPGLVRPILAEDVAAQVLQLNPGVIPDGGVEGGVPRREGCATIEGGTEIIWRMVPIENRTVGMPSERRGVTDGIGQNDRAR